MISPWPLWTRSSSWPLLGPRQVYDHTVSIRNAQPKTEEAAETPADGEYSVNVTLEAALAVPPWKALPP